MKPIEGINYLHKIYRQQSNNHDRTALSLLITQYYHKRIEVIYNYVSWHQGNVYDKEDARHDCYLYVYWLLGKNLSLDAILRKTYKYLNYSDKRFITKNTTSLHIVPGIIEDSLVYLMRKNNQEDTQLSPLLQRANALWEKDDGTLDLYVKGYSFKRIAQKLGKSYEEIQQTVTDARKFIGKKARTYNTRNYDNEILKLTSSGLDSSQVAHQLGINKTKVLRCLRRLNVKRQAIHIYQLQNVFTGENIEIESIEGDPINGIQSNLKKLGVNYSNFAQMKNRFLGISYSEFTHVNGWRIVGLSTQTKILKTSNDEQKNEAGSKPIELIRG